MLQFFAKAMVYLAMGIPQSILSFLAASKHKVLQYDVFARSAVSSGVRCAFLEMSE